ncbi:MAG: hypothetical protein HY401_06605 [Elusimicrobia bacterium]|nr:hypothetical protein [Elusimicrobiota bacterium]
MKIFHEIGRLKEFEKGFKKLSKKFRSLPEDLENFIKIELNLYHKLKKDNNGIFQIAGLPFEVPKVYKAKKFACRALKGRGVHSGIRIIYAYFEQEDRIEFIEVYSKANQDNEDKALIVKHYKKEGL